MTTSEIIGTYSRVLFELASAADAVDAVDEGLRSIIETIADNVDLRDVISDEQVSPEKKRAIVSEIFSGAVAPEAVAITAIAIERGHGTLLRSVVEQFAELAEKERGILFVEVTTASELSDGLRSSVTEKLTAALGHPVALRERVDASMLGGIRINVAGRVLDGSLSSQLDAVRGALSNASQGGEA